MDIEPICTGSTKDVVNDVCQLCGLSTSAIILNDDLKELDETLSCRWMRQRKEAIIEKVHVLLQYSRYMYHKTGIKTIFISYHPTLFDLVHSCTILSVPSNILFNSGDDIDIINASQLKTKESTLNANEEILYWLVVGIAPSKWSNDSLYADTEDPDNQDGVQSHYSLSSIINITTVARYKQTEEMQRSQTTNKQLEELIMCYMCLNVSSDKKDYIIYNDCQHTFHQKCIIDKNKYQNCPLCLSCDK